MYDLPAILGGFTIVCTVILLWPCRERKPVSGHAEDNL